MQCNICNKRNINLFKCTNCHHGIYCSVQCQKKDWKYHKKLPIHIKTSRIKSNHHFNKILSPFTGTITKLYNNFKTEEKTCGIYIAPDDPHFIFSHITGIITNIRKENLKKGFIRETKTDDYRTIKQNKTGRLYITIRSNQSQMKTVVEFFIEVGAGYITDQVNLQPLKKDDLILQGKQIGEIILHKNNSYGEIKSTNSQFLVKKLQRVKGGKTPIFEIT